MQQIFKIFLLVLDLICVYLNGWVLFWLGYFTYWIFMQNGCVDISGRVASLCNNDAELMNFYIKAIPVGLLLMFDICFALYKIMQGKFGSALLSGFILLIMWLVYILFPMVL